MTTNYLAIHNDHEAAIATWVAIRTDAPGRAEYQTASREGDYAVAVLTGDAVVYRDAIIGAANGVGDVVGWPPGDGQVPPRDVSTDAGRQVLLSRIMYFRALSAVWSAAWAAASRTHQGDEANRLKAVDKARAAARAAAYDTVRA
jgi:hypothetical protein